MEIQQKRPLLPIICLFLLSVSQIALFLQGVHIVTFILSLIDFGVFLALAILLIKRKKAAATVLLAFFALFYLEKMLYSTIETIRIFTFADHFQSYFTVQDISEIMLPSIFKILLLASILILIVFMSITSLSDFDPQTKTRTVYSVIFYIFFTLYVLTVAFNLISFITDIMTNYRYYFVFGFEKAEYLVSIFAAEILSILSDIITLVFVLSYKAQLFPKKIKAKKIPAVAETYEAQD